MVVPSWKTTLPVGTVAPATEDDTAAVKVIDAPTMDGFWLLVNAVTLGAPTTVCVPVAVDPAKFTLPAQAAEMVWVPRQARTAARWRSPSQLPGSHSVAAIHFAM